VTSASPSVENAGSLPTEHIARELIEQNDEGERAAQVSAQDAKAPALAARQVSSNRARIVSSKPHRTRTSVPAVYP